MFFWPPVVTLDDLDPDSLSDSLRGDKRRFQAAKSLNLDARRGISRGVSRGD
jgi:hypothetical protein